MNHINVSGIDRTYLIYAPAESMQGKPLLVALHGGTGSGTQFQNQSQFNSLADSEDFMVAYPNGLGGVWNAGICCGTAVTKNNADVAFIEAMINEIYNNYGINMSQVYLTGFSNGAMMAYRCSADNPEIYAAVAPVSGTLCVDDPTSTDIPLLHIHGLSDTTVPFWGGVGTSEKQIVNYGLKGVTFRSIPATMVMNLSGRSCTVQSESSIRSGGPISQDPVKTVFSCSASMQLITGQWQHEWYIDAGFNTPAVVWNFLKQFTKAS